jgi:hypothetical protein
MAWRPFTGCIVNKRRQGRDGYAKITPSADRLHVEGASPARTSPAQPVQAIVPSSLCGA